MDRLKLRVFVVVGVFSFMFCCNCLGTYRALQKPISLGSNTFAYIQYGTKDKYDKPKITLLQLTQLEKKVKDESWDWGHCFDDSNASLTGWVYDAWGKKSGVKEIVEFPWASYPGSDGYYPFLTYNNKYFLINGGAKKLYKIDLESIGEKLDRTYATSDKPSSLDFKHIDPQLLIPYKNGFLNLNTAPESVRELNVYNPTDIVRHHHLPLGFQLKLDFFVDTNNEFSDVTLLAFLWKESRLWFGVVGGIELALI